MAAKQTEVKEEKKKYIATVLEITHGGMFRNHKHYAVKVIEVPEDFNPDIIEEAAKMSTEMANKIIPRNPVKWLSTEEVEISTLDSVKEIGGKFRNLIKK